MPATRAAANDPAAGQGYRPCRALRRRIGIAVDRAARPVHVESGYSTTAINDNTTGVSFSPTSEAEAVAYVLAHPGDSIDAGLMQINAMNWRRLGLDARTVFDPQANVCVGLQVLRSALSRYNTGHVSPRGLDYAQRVLTGAVRPDGVENRLSSTQAALLAAPGESQSQESFGVENDDAFADAGQKPVP
jgi:hypothetical protein